MKKYLILMSICVMLWSSAALAAGPGMTILATTSVTAAGEVCTCDGTSRWDTGTIERFEDGADDWCTIVTTAVDWTISESGSGAVDTNSAAAFKSNPLAVAKSKVTLVSSSI